MARLLLVTVLATLIALPSTPPASAESFTGSDPAGDVQRVRPADHVDVYTAVPTRANPDITSATVRHGRSAVVIIVRFADIFVPPGPRGAFLVFGELRSDTKKAYWTMWTTQRRRQGVVQVFRGSKRCAGTSRVDYSRDRARVVLPRACLDDPTWVSVAFRARSLDGTYWWDDGAFQPGFLPSRWTPKLRAG